MLGIGLEFESVDETTPLAAPKPPALSLLLLEPELPDPPVAPEDVLLPPMELRFEDPSLRLPPPPAARELAAY